MYESWEYRVIGQGRSNVETAKLLGRDPEEVAGKIKREILTTFAEWYRRRRIETGCLGAPAEGESVIRVAMKIWSEDGFQPFLSRDEMESVAIEVCRSCFMNFQEQEWPQDIAVQKKFVSYFVRCLRRKLAKVRETVLKQRKHFRPLPDSWDAEEIKQEWEKDRRHKRWCKLLLKLALKRLGPQATAYVHYRYRNGLSVKEISGKLDVTENWLSKKYSETNLSSSKVRTSIR